MSAYLTKTVGDKKWLWLKKTNQYLQLEEGVFRVFERLHNGYSTADSIDWCIHTYHLTREQAQDAVMQVNTLISTKINYANQTSKDTFIRSGSGSFYSTKVYKFQSSFFHLFYEDAALETMFHPLFAHLGVDKADGNIIQIRLFSDQNQYGLQINNDKISVWTKAEDHLLKGQVFMAFLNAAYAKKENDWLGVMHASAIGNKQNSVLFLGDSGNGKSTASAIALASGLSLIADDFVPIDIRGRVLAFPAAISVKKQALSFLSPHFPELERAKEYELKAMNKTVRYLAPKMTSNALPVKVKSLVFIKYDATIDFEFSVLDKHVAFQHLVVDSWLSPIEENAQFFMDWIAGLPCYILSYSNNEKMIKKIKELLV